jgi:hypothetical protein
MVAAAGMLLTTGPAGAAVVPCTPTTNPAGGTACACAGLATGDTCCGMDPSTACTGSMNPFQLCPDVQTFHIVPPSQSECNAVKQWISAGSVAGTAPSGTPTGCGYVPPDAASFATAVAEIPSALPAGVDAGSVSCLSYPPGSMPMSCAANADCPGSAACIGGLCMTQYTYSSNQAVVLCAYSAGGVFYTQSKGCQLNTLADYQFQMDCAQATVSLSQCAPPSGWPAPCDLCYGVMFNPTASDPALPGQNFCTLSADGTGYTCNALLERPMGVSGWWTYAQNQASCSGAAQTTNNSGLPIITANPKQQSLFPADHTMFDVAVTDCIASATDSCTNAPINFVDLASGLPLTDAAGLPLARFYMATSDEWEDDSVDNTASGDGQTCNDIVFKDQACANGVCESASGWTVSVRKERAGKLMGRFYTLYYLVEDPSSGQSSNGSCAVVVPHDKAVTVVHDDGCRFCADTTNGSSCSTVPASVAPNGVATSCAMHSAACNY